MRSSRLADCISPATFEMIFRVVGAMENVRDRPSYQSGPRGPFGDAALSLVSYRESGIQRNPSAVGFQV